MKGISIQNGVEFKVTVEGERWSQGSNIQLEVFTHSSHPIWVALAEGHEKKLKAKDPNAFSVLASQDGVGPHLKAQFTVPKNARITDKSGSLFILYGNQNTLAHLKLTIDPHPLFIEIRDILIRQFRFALKTVVMGKKSVVEFKFEPSGAKEWASLSHLITRMSTDDSHVHLEIEFHRTVINALKPGLSAEKASRSFRCELPRRDVIHDFNQRLNSDAVTLVLEQIFAEYQNQSWLPA